MSVRLMIDAMKMNIGNSTRKLVLLKLCDNANEKGECWPSYQHIADQCECSRSAVRKHIKDLEKAGFLKITNRLASDGAHRNKSNKYLLTIQDGDISVLDKFTVLAESTGKGTLMSSGDTPVSSKNIHSVSSGDTRTYYSPESVIEPRKRNKKKRSIQNRFDELYSIYPVKRAKGQAFKAFKRLDPDDDLLIRMISAVKAQKVYRSQMLAAGLFVPEWKHPANWINDMCWEDDIPAVPDNQFQSMFSRPSSRQEQRQAVSAQVMDVKDTSW